MIVVRAYEMTCYIPYHHKYPNVTPRPGYDYVSGAESVSVDFAIFEGYDGFLALGSYEEMKRTQGAADVKHQLLSKHLYRNVCQ